jgi:predicted  nucleic acid-binding Zn-ribbon protein
MDPVFHAVALEPIPAGAVVDVQMYPSGRVTITNPGRTVDDHERRQLLVDLLAELDGLPPVAAEEVELHRVALTRLEGRFRDAAQAMSRRVERIEQRVAGLARLQETVRELDDASDPASFPQPGLHRRVDQLEETVRQLDILQERIDRIDARVDSMDPRTERLEQRVESTSRWSAAHEHFHDTLATGDAQFENVTQDRLARLEEQMASHLDLPPGYKVVLLDPPTVVCGNPGHGVVGFHRHARTDGCLDPVTPA